MARQLRSLVFNQFSPFYYAAVLYVFAFLLGVAVLARLDACRCGGPRSGCCWFTFVVHTLALVGRIYISGRPPVTNLYSSAVFIGWACVLLALVFEAIYRLGLGNIVAAVIGFLTLLIAHFLSLDGDTFIVHAGRARHAVLAGHARRLHHARLRDDVRRRRVRRALRPARATFSACSTRTTASSSTRMIYGTLCFAIFFSFVGTVLGGLWADDSWGRFWGWDPKENGALIIVLWNALVLHARWGGMVKDRGLAVLGDRRQHRHHLVAGSASTSSASACTPTARIDSNTAMWLLTFAISQAVIIALGLIPAETFRRGDKTIAAT